MPVSLYRSSTRRVCSTSRAIWATSCSGESKRTISRLGIQTVADAVPERSWRGRSLVDGKQRSRQKVPADLPLRPMRLFPNPIALGATAGLPSSVTTPPAEFHFAARHHRVAHARGPERIETGWWRGRQVRRDYFQVETTDGRRLWLFRQRDDRRWFVHGAFG